MIILSKRNNAQCFQKLCPRECGEFWVRKRADNLARPIRPIIKKDERIAICDRRAVSYHSRWNLLIKDIFTIERCNRFIRACKRFFRFSARNRKIRAFYPFISAVAIHCPKATGNAYNPSRGAQTRDRFIKLFQKQRRARVWSIAAVQKRMNKDARHLLFNAEFQKSKQVLNVSVHAAV